MCTGVPPFRGDSTAHILKAIIESAPVPALTQNPGLPAEFERILTRALEKDRDLRYQSAIEMKAALEKLRRNTVSGHQARLRMKRR